MGPCHSVDMRKRYKKSILVKRCSPGFSREHEIAFVWIIVFWRCPFVREENDNYDGDDDDDDENSKVFWHKEHLSHSHNAKTRIYRTFEHIFKDEESIRFTPHINVHPITAFGLYRFTIFFLPFFFIPLNIFLTPFIYTTCKMKCL